MYSKISWHLSATSFSHTLQIYSRQIRGSSDFFVRMKIYLWSANTCYEDMSVRPDLALQDIPVKNFLNYLDFIFIKLHFELLTVVNTTSANQGQLMKRISFLILGIMALVLFLNCNPTSSNNNNSTTVTDADGNVYHTVTIGTQTWTVENLKTTHYNDGTAIPLVTDSVAWRALTTPGYCWYNNDADTNKATYGALYNFYVVNTGKLAPVGWHVPTDSEWTALENYLIAHGYNYDNTTTGNKIAKALASKTAWFTSTNTGTIGNNMSANNRSGFSALPAGFRGVVSSFYSIGSHGVWWSATEPNASDANYRDLYYSYSDLYRGLGSKSCGFSVRLVKD